MKKALRRNWFPKIVSLLLATAIWFLIKDHLSEQDNPDGSRPPRAILVPEE